MSDLKSSMMNVLAALMSNDNAARGAAETFFQTNLSQDCMSMIQTLLSIVADVNCDKAGRSLCGVLLRGALEKEQSKFSPENLAALRGMLIQLWQSESDSLILKRISHVMAQSAMSSSWIDLIPQIVNYATQALTSLSNDNNNKSMISIVISAFSLIEVIAEYCPTDILTHIQILGMFLSSNLNHNNIMIKISCAKSCCSVIIALGDEPCRDSFKPAIQPIINVMGDALNNGDEIDATDINDYLVQIALHQPIFFKGNLDHVVNAMLSIAQNSNQWEFTTRSMALELMVTLTETAPALARRCPGLVQGMVPLAMNIMLEVEDSETEWLQGRYDDDVEDDNYLVGEEAIERAACGMGGKTVAPIVLNLVQTYSTNSDWLYRRAAVSSIARLAEGSPNAFKNHFDIAINFLVTSITTDPSIRVKYEAVQAVGQFAILFTNEKQFHKLCSIFIPICK
jgi:importin-5